MVTPASLKMNFLRAVVIAVLAAAGATMSVSGKSASLLLLLPCLAISCAERPVLGKGRYALEPTGV